ncbi:ubiquinol-cytochrome c reductase cytochrome b subunit [Brevibacterium sp. 50QC2O2]|uniref:cytochrome bc1 complex cytochrome b subunit n=1 Tax=Brevibacterium TaxID=1696 RepID=UPI00211BA8CD|nr:MULTISPECIES: ubiquinol-cytochrome c reductase cytochrome b subunit [unclassified Brevibacterium]MCQ9366695.1 ubiquinol-cytochrome c reductase cytochrome b subunit [Brevibacterium sp. 91QC2O2]MCQ9384328.1 ubiquinol-cytochrome c reductase cytochrome b subunit [Brevibacterium sp. 68QC2CO]MCQ9388947.1 ubiquinol-cytochrome c reductase cytochrome b subunit [Brevibacterium sp. 50QC2O2]
MSTDLNAPPALAATSKWIEERTGASAAVKEFGRKIFPAHWSFMLGEVALYSFIVLVLSGTFLTLWFHPAMGETHYEGPWTPLKGVEVSEAYASTLYISFEVRGGLFLRQIHHWAALLFMAALSIHALRIFFTGAYRKPREVNWIVGVGLVAMGMAAGFTGYSLPDDLLSGNGLRIIDGLLKSIPLIGTYLSFFLFGGEFPGTDIVSRLYSVHIMIVPALLIALIGVHLMFVVIHKHTQWPGAGHTEKNVVGEPVLPTFAAKGGGFFFMIFGLLSAMAGLFTINPIWNYGPYDPSPVSAGTQPDWYIGWMDGFLRLLPGWMEFYVFGYPISLNIFPALLAAAVLFGGMVVWPFIEAWISGDRREHHILDRPRNAPTRTALGVAVIIWYCAMWAAASGDLIAVFFHMSLNDMIYVFRTLFFVGPVIGYIVTKRICIGLQRKDREIALHGFESGEIIRLPHGEYQERHKPLDEHERWRLTAFQTPSYVPAQPDARGKVSGAEKARAALSKFFYEDRVEPVTKAELDEAHAAHAVEGHGSTGELEH